MSINRITSIYAYNYYGNINGIKALNDCCSNFSVKNREIITIWRFDEEGNIVYYTLDKNTREILSITKYKNINKLM